MTAPVPPAEQQPLAIYLAPSWFVDADHPAVAAYAQRAAGDSGDERQRAVRLFYAVRDDIRYSAYDIGLARASFRASDVLARGRGWCVNKSCLLAACCRAVDIPCRLGYADVRNHLATKKLLRRIGTDIFYYHGYNDIYLDGRWVKATVAFNRSLCEKARILPLEFDGRTDSLYHPFDLEGRRHMEYLHDYGQYADVEYDAILAKFAEHYPRITGTAGEEEPLRGDFEAEIEAEARSSENAPS